MPELICAADDPRWRDERRRGVTATDITAITGLSPYESEYSLWCKKTGLVEDTHEDTPRLRLGRDLEPLIVDRWAEANGGLLPLFGALYRSSARPWQMATLDRYMPRTSGMEPLEVKSWADMDRVSWDDGPPPRVRAQVLWQMDTLDVATGHVGVLFLPSGEFRSYAIAHNHGPLAGIDQRADCLVCTDTALLRAAGAEFMARVRGELPPPSPDASSATLAALKARFAPYKGKETEIDGPLWEAFRDECKLIDEATEAKHMFESQIREQAGEATILTVGGVKVATRVVSTQHVKAHDRHVDYIRRAKNGGTDE